MNNGKKVEMSELHFLNQSDCYISPGINDVKNWQEIVESCETLGLNLNFDKIFSIVSAVILLGNVEFDDTENKEQANSPCKVIQVKLLE